MGTKLKRKKCKQCGTDDYNVLTKHRILQGWIGGTYHPDNVEILCERCHRLAHLKKRTRQVSVPIVLKHSSERPAEEFAGDKFWTYSLYWYLLKLEDMEGGLWIGVCSYSKRVFDFEASRPLADLAALMVNDVIISEKEGCEFKFKCLVTKCKYNKTTLKSYVEHKELDENGKDWLKKNWNRITNLRPLRALCKGLGIQPHR